MEAEIGDQLIIENTGPTPPLRVGTAAGLQSSDGSPRYVVHWLAGDYDSLIMPGPRTRIEVRHKHAAQHSVARTGLTVRRLR